MTSYTNYELVRNDFHRDPDRRPAFTFKVEDGEVTVSLIRNGEDDWVLNIRRDNGWSTSVQHAKLSWVALCAMVHGLQDAINAEK